MAFFQKKARDSIRVLLILLIAITNFGDSDRAFFTRFFSF